MTEAEWLAGTKLLPLLNFVRVSNSYRRLRLFGCACARHSGVPFVSDVARNAVEASESYADKTCDRFALKRAQYAVWVEFSAPRHTPEQKELIRRAAWAADHRPKVALGHVAFPAPGEGGGEVYSVAGQRCVILLDIFGNPFRPVTFDPAWRTDTAVSLANGMYESRDFSVMPILADALQDAGCDSDDLLNHCRDPQQVHVRGCWVVDLVLGKA